MACILGKRPSVRKNTKRKSKEGGKDRSQYLPSLFQVCAREKGETVMKNVMGFVLIGASLLFASAAQAQQYRMKADIPFDFVIGHQVHKAGSYDIKSLSGNVLMVDSTSEGKATIVNAIPCMQRDWAKTTKLVFHRSGDTYFLYQAWVEGRQFGSEFAAPKMETRLAQNGAKTEEVIVAAVLEH
jgi:hypothetical protein